MADKVNQERDVTTIETWRQEACRLAFSKGLDGQAIRLKDVQKLQRYLVVTAGDFMDHQVLYDLSTSNILCDCYAAQYLRPCSHAGAVLLLVAHLAPPRPRDPNGHAMKGYYHE